jgi:hypothetical protein
MQKSRLLKVFDRRNAGMVITFSINLPKTSFYNYPRMAPSMFSHLYALQNIYESI